MYMNTLIVVFMLWKSTYNIRVIYVYIYSKIYLNDMSYFKDFAQSLIVAIVLGNLFVHKQLHINYVFVILKLQLATAI